MVSIYSVFEPSSWSWAIEPAGYPLPVEDVGTLIIGGGQAGLAMSHMLSQRGIPHCVLERHRIAERWHSERWIGLRFQFPNWSILLPDFPFRHCNPDGFAKGSEIADYITSYAAFTKAPVRCGVKVTALRPAGNPSGFVAETSRGPVRASNVVVATGPYQRPTVPSIPLGDNSVFQLHANTYKSPDQLPPGAVLIVGSGASGAQIAEELQLAGRRVYLSVGRHRRLPRRYCGRDLIWWLSELGLDRTTAEQRGPNKTLPLITGAYGGHTVDFRDFAKQGITLLGRVLAAQDGKLEIASDLRANLAYGDAAYAEFLDRVDRHVDANRFDLPSDPAARTEKPEPACLTEPIPQLDLRAAAVKSLIWATGYALDFDWIKFPVFDNLGEPNHRGGVTKVPGLYFLGLQWLSKLTSSFLSGVGDDAARLADHIAARKMT